MNPTASLVRQVLPNGVTLLVQPRRAAPAATLATLVRAGFLDEPDELVGISHVLEHMLFKGTPSIAPGELAQRTKALGGSLNAYTSYDRTVYYASVPARNIHELIALQADQVRNPLLDADELRRELGVIIQEANRKLDSPGAVAGETLHELLYDSHRIRRWRIGVAAMLEQFTRDDVAGYHASRYVPERTIVSLVGDVDEEVALASLREQWSDWRRPHIDIPAGPVETAPAAVRTRRLSGDVALAEVVLGWRGPGVLHDDVPALSVLAAILATGRASRFGRELRERGLVNAVGAYSYGVIDTGVFSIGIELDPSRIGVALDVVGGAMRDLATRECDAAEFARAVAMLRARIGRRLERYETRATALADAEALGDVTRLDREESDILAVTPARVRDVAERYLTPGSVSAVAYLPRGSDVRFDEGVLRAAMPVILSEATATPSRSRRTSESLSNVGVDAQNRGPFTSHRAGSSTAVLRTFAQDDRHQVHHIALPDTDILTARFGQTGQTSLHIYRPRAARETPATAGLGALAVRTMVRGTQRRTAAELAFALESLGGALSPSLGSDVIGFGTTVLSEHAQAAAAILSEVFHEPRFASESVETERALLIEDALAVADDMVRFPVQLALGAAFGDTGYGSPSLGTAASLASFTTESLRQWHAAMLDGGRTTVIAVGDADPEQMAEMLAVIPSTSSGQALSGAKDRFVTDRSLASLGMTPGFRIEHRERKQAALAMLFPGPSRREHERFAAETWGAIAAGLGGRMFESLRSKRSLAYTVIANSWQRQQAGGLLTYIACDPARLDEARDAMLEELELFRREPPSDDELHRATAMLAGHAEMSRQTAGAFAGEIADAWLLGEGLGELEDPAAPYRAVTAADVHAVTARSLDPALRAEGVVDSPAVRPPEG